MADVKLIVMRMERDFNWCALLVDSFTRSQAPPGIPDK